MPARLVGTSIPRACRCRRRNQNGSTGKAACARRCGAQDKGQRSRFRQAGTGTSEPKPSGATQCYKAERLRRSHIPAVRNTTEASFHIQGLFAGLERLHEDAVLGSLDQGGKDLSCASVAGGNRAGTPNLQNYTKACEELPEW